jgi:membrane protein implicated in regulation of membrane protease activity
MHADLYWALAGLILVIIELMTGTFYLIVIGVGAFAGALIAYFGFPVGTQAAGATMIAFIGVAFAHTLRARPGRQASPSIDAGQTVILESWIDRKAGLARVRYRDTLWDARVEGESGDSSLYYIRGTDGSTLLIAPTRS